jgi:hypothetical protein
VNPSTMPTNKVGLSFKTHHLAAEALMAGRIQENWLVPAAEKVGLCRIGWHTFRHNYCALVISPSR